MGTSYDWQCCTWNAPIARILAVVNQKGGVGKTTTAVNLAAGFALAERPTLLVDLDPQGNATTGLGLQKSGLYPTVYHVILGNEPTEKAVRETALTQLKLLPSDIDLVGAEIELVSVGQREYRLRVALEPVAEAYDYVIVDCPPSLGLLTINALAAADRVLVPLQCEFYALEGLTHLLKTIKLVRERLNPRLSVEGIVLTMFDGRTSLAVQIRDEVHRYFPGEIFDTVIPRNVRLSEAPSYGKPVMLLGALLSATPGADDVLIEIPVDQVEANPDQPRKSFSSEALEELIASIRASGVIQPVIVRRRGVGYQLIAGERRWRAARRAQARGFRHRSRRGRSPGCARVRPVERHASGVRQR